MKISKTKAAVLCLMIVFSVVLNLAGCGEIEADDLTLNISARPVDEKPADGDFIGAQADFAVRLFQESCVEGENTLISPLSVMLALALTANGASDETRTQMENVLGAGMTVEELNEYLYSYINNLPCDDRYKLHIANSIWFRNDADRFAVSDEFLQTNADYYGAAAYKSAFDSQTVRDINTWVCENTDGMIKEILSEIRTEDIMYLINALVFEAQWQTAYERGDISDGYFTNAQGEIKNVDMMSSKEYRYLDDGSAAGFIKDYANGKYSFAAMLPNEGVNLSEYIDSLSGETLMQTLSGAENTIVNVTMPKFKYEYSCVMNDALSVLGMPSAFDELNADFSGIGQSSNGNIIINRVIHKSFISVDELGTKAGAATVVAEGAGAAMEITVPYSVTLDRPFVYFIIDNSTGLPLFIGAAADI